MCLILARPFRDLIPSSFRVCFLAWVNRFLGDSLDAFSRSSALESACWVVNIPSRALHFLFQRCTHFFQEPVPALCVTDMPMPSMSDRYFSNRSSAVGAVAMSMFTLSTQSAKSYSISHRRAISWSLAQSPEPVLICVKASIFECRNRCSSASCKKWLQSQLSWSTYF